MVFLQYDGVMFKVTESYKQGSLNLDKLIDK